MPRGWVRMRRISAGPLVDYKPRAIHSTIWVPRTFDGTEAHKLRVTRSNGDVTYVYSIPITSSRSARSIGASSTACPTETVIDYGDL